MFIEVEFPRTVSFKAMGGPNFNTTVNEGFSGFEQRNMNWLASRSKWVVSLTTPAPEFITTKLEYIMQLQALFLVVGGKANGFRLRDHKDFDNAGVPQFFGTGDGVTGTFLLAKNYTVGGFTYVRNIQKPVTSLVVDYQNNPQTDTVSVYIGPTELTANPGYIGGGTAQYTLDETTGFVNFGAYSVWLLNSVSVSGTIATYGYSITSGAAPSKNQKVFIQGMQHSPNNVGLVPITSVTQLTPTTGTFTIVNAIATTESGSTGTGTIYAGKLTITGATQSGGSTTYAYTLAAGQAPTSGMRATVTGFSGGSNDNVVGAFITGTGAGTFTVTNPSGTTASASATGFLDWVPALNALLYATYQFDFPVRFDTDDLDIQIEDSNVLGGDPIVSWNSITLRELRIVVGQSQG